MPKKLKRRTRQRKSLNKHQLILDIIGNEGISNTDLRDELSSGHGIDNPSRAINMAREDGYIIEDENDRDIWRAI